MNKKFLVFDTASLLYISTYLLYNLGDRNLTTISYFLSLFWTFIPVFVTVVVTIILYKKSINKSVKKLILFSLFYLLVILLYRLFLIFLTELGNLFELWEVTYSGVINETIVLLTFEIVITNIIYNYFFKNDIN